MSYLTNKRKVQIQHCAEELLRKHNSFTAGFNIFELYKKIGLESIPYNFGDEVTSVILFEHNRVGYTTEEKEEIQRVILAHSLGHISLKHRDFRSDEVHVEKFEYLFTPILTVDYILKNSRIIQEYEANIFMLSLLMPDELFQNEIFHLMIRDNGKKDMISQLCKKFKVPSNFVMLKLMISKL